MFNLIDDGTLDTVIICPDCNEEQHYTKQEEEEEFDRYGDVVIATEQEKMSRYDEFVDYLIEEANKEHVCTQSKPYTDEVCLECDEPFVKCDHGYSRYVELKIAGELD